MSSVKGWRRAALSAYSLFGLALTMSCYTAATTAENSNSMLAMEAHLEDYERKALAASDEILSAAAVMNTGGSMDDREYGPLNWARIVPEVMPSVVNISTIEQALERVEMNRAWLIPGVQTNQATELLTGFRSWKFDWAKKDSKRDWRISGAGFLIGDGLHVLTAAHVLDGQESVRVKVADGEWRAARVIGLDVSRDVGLLLINGEPGRPITPAPFMPRQGQAVMAIGAPGGLGFSVSAGIVSRYSEDTYFKTDRFLQIDAPIIGGNSGGVVVNAKGEAVGVVSYGMSNFTQTIPIDRALRVAGELQSGRL